MIEPSNELACVDTDIEALAQRARERIHAGIPDNTRRTYDGAWRRFEAFCRERNVPFLPAESVTVLAYLASLSQRGLKPSSYTAALAAIRFRHQHAGFENPGDDAIVRAFIRGERRSGTRARAGKSPLRLAALRSMVRLIPEHASGIRNRALILLGWFGAFRRSELVALRIEDLRDVDAGVEVYIAKSKTDRSARGEIVAIPYASDLTVCPVRALAKWRALLTSVTQTNEGPLFPRFYSNGRLGGTVSAGWVRLLVLRYAEEAGFDARQLSAHSLRSGFATDASHAGKHVRAIQMHLRHASPGMTLRYIRAVELWEDNPATGLA